MDSKARVTMQQMTVADYRVEVMCELRNRLGDGFVLWCGEEYFEPTTRTVASLPEWVSRVHNVFVLGRRVAWQRGLLRPLVQADSVVMEFNPRVVSVWAVLLARRALRRRTALWGHAWPRSGPASRTTPLRLAMGRIASTLIVYTESDREQLTRRLPRTRVVAAPNALYRRANMQPRTGRARHVLYSGRLVASKKPGLLVDAFLWAHEQGLDGDTELLLAGSGPELAGLRQRCASHPAGGKVRFLGHVDPATIGEHYRECLVTVSPGYVGLSMIQSLSFGVPMIYARDEPHSPEIEAARPGFNAIAFASNDPQSLGRALIGVQRDRETWIERRSRIAEECRRRYSVDVLADRILEAVS